MVLLLILGAWFLFNVLGRESWLVHWRGPTPGSREAVQEEHLRLFFKPDEEVPP